MQQPNTVQEPLQEPLTPENGFDEYWDTYEAYELTEPVYGTMGEDGKTYQPVLITPSYELWEVGTSEIQVQPHPLLNHNIAKHTADVGIFTGICVTGGLALVAIKNLLL